MTHTDLTAALVDRFRSLNHLGTPVVPFFPFYLGVSLLKLNSRKKDALIIKGLLGNLVIITPCYCSFQSLRWSDLGSSPSTSLGKRALKCSSRRSNLYWTQDCLCFALLK